MRNKFLSLAFITAFLMVGQIYSITITNFGANFTGVGGATFNTGTNDWAGSTIGSTLFGNIATVDASSSNQIDFTATPNVAVPLGAAFTFSLYDGSTGGTLIGSFALDSADMNNGGASVLFADITGGSGVFSNIGGVVIQTGGAPVSFDINMGSLSATAVPEPSAFALIAGAFGIASVMVRRRR